MTSICYLSWYLVTDSRLTVTDHVASVSSVCRLAYYHAQQMRPIVQSLTVDATKALQALSPVALTITMKYHMATLTNFFNGCSLLTMWLRGWSLIQIDVNICRLYENYTGCQSNVVSSSRWSHWCSRHWMVWCLYTWPTIVSWSAATFADFVQLSFSHVWSRRQRHDLTTDHLQLPAHESVSLFQLPCKL